MDWTKIEKDFLEELNRKCFIGAAETTAWFKQRIESEQPPPPLNKEEKNEFYITDLTVDNIKANYGN